MRPQTVVYPSYEEFAILMNAFSAREIAEVYGINIQTLYKWYERGGEESKKYMDKEQMEEKAKRISETFSRMDKLNPEFKEKHATFLEVVGKY